MEAWREELYHSARGTTWSRHTYVAKEKVNGKWIYFYSLKDWDNWKKGSQKKTQQQESKIPEKNYKPSKTTGTKKISDVKKEQANKLTGTKSTDSKKKSGSSKSSKTTSKGGKVKATASSSKKNTEKKEKAASSGSSKKAKSETEKVAKQQTVKQEKTQSTNPVNLNFLKNTFNIQENETKQRDSSDPQALQAEMENDYDDGAYGYLVVETANGTETFRWQKYNGEVTLKAFDSDTPLSFAQLPKSTNMIDLRVDNKKK